MTELVAMFYVVFALALAAGFVGLLFYVRAVRAAEPGTPWSVRAQPLYLLIKPEVWTAKGRRYWRLHFVFMGVCLVCMAVIALLERFGPAVR